MPLSQASAEFMAALEAEGAKPLDEMTPSEARDVMDSLKAMTPPGPDLAKVEDVDAPLPDGTSIPVRVYVPDDHPRGLIVFFHGGGWVLGTLDAYDQVLRLLAQSSGFAVASVGYRLAPEHRYPTAVDDCTAAFAWIAQNRSVLGSASGPIVVAGDSAGGNLAAVVARRLRDTTGPQPSLQILVYPVTDADTDTAGYTDPENQRFLDRNAMVWFWNHYVPDGARRSEPDASPLRAPELAGLPAALVITAEYDPLRDEGEAYAARLAEAGVPTTVFRHDGQMHGFFGLPFLGAQDAAIEQITAALDDAVG